TTNDNAATITFSATANPGSTFGGWNATAGWSSTTCSGTTNPCQAVAAGGATMTVTFNGPSPTPTPTPTPNCASLTASSSKTAILCNGGSSIVTVSATGGTPPYSGRGTFSHAAGS